MQLQNSIKLLFYADEPIICEAIRLIFAQAVGIKLGSIVDEVERILPVARESQPDVLLLSLTPALHLGVLAGLCEAAPDCRIVLWNRSLSREIAHQAIDLGVRGILARTCSTELMLKALHKVHEGELWFHRQLTASHIQSHRIGLTPRQAQLALLVAEGRTNKQMATDLSLTEGAVRVYLSHLFDKVGIKDRTELAHVVLRNVQSMEYCDQLPAGASTQLRALYVETSGL